MEIRTIKINLLEQNVGQVPGLPSNPRTWTRAELDLLKASIVETPELLEARGLIVYPYGGKYVTIGGNMRYSALLELGESEAPCIVLPVDTSSDKLKEIAAKDNGSFGKHDWDKLANEWDDLPLSSWGIPTWQANDEKAKDSKEGGSMTRTKEYIEVRCELGETWLIGDHRLMRGDSISLDEVKRLLGSR